MAVTAGLICCAAVGIGFYGNSETNDGVYQLLYALDHANHTLTGIDSLVAGTTLQMRVGLEQHLARLNELLAARGDYLQTLKFMQQLAGSIVLQLSGLPVWRGTSTDLTALAGNIAYVEYYRWLAYLLFFILVLTVCLLACLGLAKRSRCLLTTMLCCGLLTLILSWASMAVDTAAAVGTSDFCVAPDKFIMNQTESDISTEVVHYYLYCDQSLSNPFQQALTVFQRSLTTMQIQIQGLIQFALPLFPTAEKDLLGVQQLLNSSETSLHQLTAMLDCRGLHKPCPIPSPTAGLPGRPYRHLLRRGGGFALPGPLLPAGGRLLLHHHLRHAACLEALCWPGPGLRRHGRGRPLQPAGASHRHPQPGPGAAPQLLQLQQQPGQPEQPAPPGTDHLQRPRLRVHEPSRALWWKPALRERPPDRQRLSSSHVLPEHASHLPVRHR
ncbi:protein tweety homolog 2 isoform X2 [Aptenodytes patagonicus]|uniref:protein tweety homolog 2 isoform X2 n=1 Tax=Aptenodytes patagonicus TaxID=9234 RepID=UPI003FA04157